MEDEMPRLPPAAPTETEINAAFEVNNGSATGTPSMIDFDK